MELKYLLDRNMNRSIRFILIKFYIVFAINITKISWKMSSYTWKIVCMQCSIVQSLESKYHLNISENSWKQIKLCLIVTTNSIQFWLNFSSEKSQKSTDHKFHKKSFLKAERNRWLWPGNFFIQKWCIISRNFTKMAITPSD